MPPPRLKDWPAAGGSVTLTRLLPDTCRFVMLAVRETRDA